MSESTISVVINTLNEEKRLALTLQSVCDWANEIVVVDMYSEDRTVEIAQKYGARVFYHQRVGFVEPARALGLAQSTGDWILVLDADEMVPQPLSVELQKVVRSDQWDVVSLPMLNYLLGRPLMHTGWGPPGAVRHLRFFRRGYVQADPTIHTPIRPAPGARRYDLPWQPGLALVHFNYIDTSHFLTKLDRYTGIEAQQAYARGKRAASTRALLSAGREFIARYLTKQGFRDGWQGFYLSLFMAFYRLVFYAKLKELQTLGRAEDIETLYDAEGRRLLAEYERQRSTRQPGSREKSPQP